MRKIDSIIPQTISQIGISGKFNEEVVLFKWREIVGEEIASRTQPGIIRRGHLTVNVNNSVWTHHLTTMKSDIINKINSFIGQKLIEDIRFQAGYFRSENEQIQETENPKVPHWKAGEVTDEERKAIEDLSSEVSNEHLRRRIQSILVKDFSLKRAKEKMDWKNCRVCGVPCPPGSEVCTSCGIEQHHAEMDKLRKLLWQAPWLKYEETTGFADCRKNEYQSIRSEIADKLMISLISDESDRVKLMFLAMLLFFRRPETIDEEVMTKTLEKVRRKKNVSAPRS